MKHRMRNPQKLSPKCVIVFSCLALAIVFLPFAIAQENPWEKPPNPPGQSLTKTPVHILDVSPSAFKAQGADEFILDTRYNVIVGLPIRGKPSTGGVDLTKYDLEFTFHNANGRQIQLWYKNSSWRNVYSYPFTILKEQPIRYNPFANGRNVDEFDDFSHIYAIGAKIFGGIKDVQIASVKLIRRD